MSVSMPDDAAGEAERHIGPIGTDELAWRQWPGWHRVSRCGVDELLHAHNRLVIVAAHPDDETLAAGGLISLARAHELVIVAVTGGEASHPGSAEWPRERLRIHRRLERAAALDELRPDGPPAVVVELGVDDGRVAQNEDAVSARLRSMLQPEDVVVTPWRYDGHPDHEAVGRAVLAAVRQCQALVLQAPIWGWHWASPHTGSIPAEHAVALELPKEIVQRKLRAVRHFTSQLSPDPTTGADAILPARTLRYFARNVEVFLTEAAG